MSGRGRRATQPKRGWRPPVSVNVEELTYAANLDDSDGPFVLDVSKWDAPKQMSREILETFRKMVEIEGRWRQKATVRSNFYDIRHFATWVARWESPSVQGLEQPKSISDITPAMWDAYRLEQPTTKGANNRLIRVAATLNASGLLTAEAATRVNARKRLNFDAESKVEYYSDEEFRAIMAAVKRVVREANARIAPNYEAALRGSDHTGEPTRESVLYELLVSSSLKSRKKARLIDKLGHTVNVWDPDLGQMKTVYGHIMTYEARRMLYPDAGEGLAAAVLLATLRGLNMSQIESLTIPKRDIDTAGEISQVSTDKPRRGPGRRFSLEVFSNTGDNTDGKWLQRIEEMTTPLRHHLELAGQPTERLILAMDKKGKISTSTLTGGSTGGRRLVKWLEGLPVIDFKKLKRTFETRHSKESTQNIEAVHLDVYMRNDPERIAEYQDLAATAIDRAYRHALETVQLTFVDEDAPEAATAEDTAISACVDPEHEPTTGLPCADGFLGCLSCPNAIATPRHVPLMKMTMELLEELRSALPDHLWATRFQQPHAQLQVLLAAAPIGAGSRRATKAQKALIREALGTDSGAL